MKSVKEKMRETSFYDLKKDDPLYYLFNSGSGLLMTVFSGTEGILYRIIGDEFLMLVKNEIIKSC